MVLTTSFLFLFCLPSFSLALGVVSCSLAPFPGGTEQDITEEDGVGAKLPPTEEGGPEEQETGQPQRRRRSKGEGRAEHQRGRRRSSIQQQDEPVRFDIQGLFGALLAQWQ